MGKAAVVTGATGMIGRALTKELIDDGYRVYAVIREGTRKGSDIESGGGLTVVRADLSELGRLPDLIPSPCECFYHLGWAGTFGDERNDAYLQNDNVRFTLDAVGAANALGCKTFLGVGSQAEYGRVEGDLTPETPANPENGYGAAKLCAGTLSRIACAQAGVKHVWARVLSVYGPYDGPGTMVMHVIDSLLAERVPELTPCCQLWDYLYCDDAAVALRLAAERGRDGAVYCVGSGRALPLERYVEAIKSAVDPGATVGIGMRPYAPNQVMRLRADISSLTRDTGFAPAVGFEEGIARTVAWRRGCQKRKTAQ